MHQSLVYLSLGSNIEPETNLRHAVRLLSTKGVVLSTSSLYRTPPQGFAAQDDFLNMAVQFQTPLTPVLLKKDVLDWIEQQLGRRRDPQNKNAPRTIDLDISLWDNTVLEYGEKPWRIPDPDILRFAHVALPLAEIAPDYIHPAEHISLQEIASRFGGISFQRIPFSGAH
jgi:2-amino-4-hydroxy-6-hydroxymethyldihydropteridine diphosphokinase